MLTEYNIKVYDNGASVITSGNRSKTTYNTKDIVYKKDDAVVGVVVSDGRLAFGERDLMLDIVQVPRPTNELASYLKKKEVLKNLHSNPNYYDDYVRSFIKGGVEKMTPDIVKKFFDIK